MSYPYCSRCKYNATNGDCECPERAGIRAHALESRVAELESQRALALRNYETAKAENARLSERVSTLEEHKRLLFEENGRLLAEKESGQWDRNMEAYRHVHFLQTAVEVYREAGKTHIAVRKISAPIEAALKALSARQVTTAEVSSQAPGLVESGHEAASGNAEASHVRGDEQGETLASASPTARDVHAHTPHIYRVEPGEGFQADQNTYCTQCLLSGVWRFDGNVFKLEWKSGEETHE